MKKESLKKSKNKDNKVNNKRENSQSVQLKSKMRRKHLKK